MGYKVNPNYVEFCINESLNNYLLLYSYVNILTMTCDYIINIR